MRRRSPAPSRLLSANDPARFACSVVNALATAHCRYQSFAVRPFGCKRPRNEKAALSTFCGIAPAARVVKSLTWLATTFFLQKEVIASRMLDLLLLSAKGHVRVFCSLVNAFATKTSHHQPFAVLRLRRASSCTLRRGSFPQYETAASV